MKGEPIDLVHGSGNVYRDFGYQDADARQLKSILAAEIIKALNENGLTVRKAHSLTGIAAADFSKIRNADFSRFTTDRLTAIINKLGPHVEFTVHVEHQPISGTAL